ncbi:MAG TPA: nucleotidyltransferase family protein [Candidatus Deferrimicrobium sp.]|nr:nucleotidyltransferase family protein [Candidatus Deferrimicrobium sp.]
MVRLVVMAAGAATRMGQDKLALPWGTSTVLGHVLQVTLKAIDILNNTVFDPTVMEPDLTKVELIVVARKPIDSYLGGTTIQAFQQHCGIWIEVPNPQPLSETIRSGLKGVSEVLQGVCFIPGDQVGLEPCVFAELIQSFIKTHPGFLIPCADSITGSPVFFNREYLPELENLQGEQGGKAILAAHPESWITYPVNSGLFNDVDTIEVYNHLWNKEHTH